MASAVDAIATTVRGGPRQGRDALAPDHARHPRDRVRRARRRRHPAAARPDGRLRDLRAVVAGTSHVFPMANEAGALVLLIGLAVGVDYSIFYLKREREERAAGRSERAAHRGGRRDLRPLRARLRPDRDDGDGRHVPDGRPGRSSRSPSRRSLVVAIAMLGSLTVLPALLSRLGDRVDRGRVPLVGRLRRDDGEGRIWGAIVDRVLRRPLLSAVLAGGLLRRPGAARRSSCGWSSQAPTRSRSRSPPCRRTSGCSRRSPARRSRPTWSSRRRT